MSGYRKNLKVSADDIDMKIEEIKDPRFLQRMTEKQLTALCSEIRKFIIRNVAKTGGHLSSNLGVLAGAATTLLLQRIPPHLMRVTRPKPPNTAERQQCTRDRCRKPHHLNL